MKILCISSSYWPAFQHGGPIYSVHALNKALTEKGVDVYVYTTNVGLKKKVPVNQMVELDGIKVTYFRFLKFFEFMGATGWQFSLPLTRALKNNLEVFDIIYIIGIWNYPIAVAAYYSRQYKKPYIISPRGVLYRFTIKKKFWKKWFYYYFIARKDLRSASAIHYTTEDEFENCHLPLGLINKAIVIPNGINIDEFSNLPGKEVLRKQYPYLKDKKVILFLGRINWKKGFDLLVKAYSRLVKERDDVHLLIVGSDEEGYGQKVKRWLNDEGVLERVTFTGMLLGKEKLEAFAGSDIFVLPSYSENFGMAVVEAMACSLPVIISDQVGICKEVEKAKAGIVIHTEQNELYNALVELLDNKRKSLETRRNGRKLVGDNFNCDYVAEQVKRAFEEILKERK
jgi:glycosyltransferase involved in cell wall biosynthesis